MDKNELLKQLNDPTLPYTNIILDAKDVDYDTLHADTKADLGDKFIGLSSASCDEGEFIVLHVAKNATGSEKSKARLTFDEHDITKIPPKPIVKPDKQRIDELEALVAQLMAERGVTGQAQKVTKDT